MTFLSLRDRHEAKGADIKIPAHWSCDEVIEVRAMSAIMFGGLMRRGQRYIIPISLALLLTCCAREPWGPLTEADRNEVACQGYGFYPGTRQYDECLRYVESRRGDSPLTLRQR
jgi:hypothetical protein